MTRGAGGFSIAPSLHVQSIWSESSERYHEASELMIGCILDESIIPRLQTAFLERRLSPFDTFYSLPPYRDRMMFHVMSTQCLDLNPPQAFSNLIKFMLECGMKPKTDDRELFGGLLALFGLIELAVNDLPSVLELIELRGPLQLWHLTHYPEILKRNLRLILSQDEELCHMPRITKAIIRESEDELRKALASGDASPDDIVDESGRISALEFAFGWPKGIQVLLQSGANVPAHFDAFVSGEGEQYNASAALLLQGGYCFGWYDVFWSTKGNDDGTRQALLVHELAERRIRLWMLIKSSLLADEIPPLDDGSMLDGYASNLCKALAGLGIDIPKSLCVLIEGNQDSIYQKLADMDMPAIRLMDSLYDAGFHDVDLPNSEGRTPLMRVWPFVHNIPEFFRRVAWLMSKGASIERRLPQSNAKVAHLLTNRIIRCHFLYPRGVNESPYNASDEWKKLAAGWKDAYFFVPTIHDHCNCACSLGGCTTLSVALRGILSWIPRFELEGHMDHLRPWFLSLVAWQSSWPHLARVVLRSLTFDALGLTHTCCIEINAYDAYPIQTGRSDAEISRILDEEHCLLQDFEELLQEMESKFDELGLSIEEFLDDYWYDCVIKYLSRRDSYDEHHVREARRLGIFLEAKEFHIPNVASLSICSQIREL
ncbi:hypothetical protein N7457_005794 [Penicillium paradoxum]|uniref:uncharacterized protein n=1 Tax=Penicillium paradoxum TaxID=176176 RepID=UPI002548AA45|nr:uncharacterized protein N7457_005794 [Penicillium paradoxum]KAJ5780634.1 hypothetical protein N7457_005794 [Penicillium paradoxum]